jgi:hypothetical protein
VELLDDSCVLKHLSRLEKLLHERVHDQFKWSGGQRYDAVE